MQNGNSQNVTEPDFFEKICFGQIWAKKCLKIGFFGLCAKLVHYFFLIFFCTMMQNGNGQNVTEPDFRKKLGQKLPKNRVFWTLCKIASLVFSDFWQKDRVQGTLKCGRNNFSRKILNHCKNPYV